MKTNLIFVCILLLLFSQELSSENSSCCESIAIIPDTQYYNPIFLTMSERGRNLNLTMYEQQTKQITGNDSRRDQISSYNIKAAIHLGDHVNDGEQVPQAWAYVKTAYQYFIDSDMPFLPVQGNHDVKTIDYGVDAVWDYFTKGFDGKSFIDNDDTIFNKSFAKLLNFYQKPIKKDYFIANRQASTNIALTRIIGGIDFLLISIEYKYSPEDLQWAKDLCNQYPNKRVIIALHSYLNNTSLTELDYQNGNIWGKLIYPCRNIDFVICGHDSGDLIRKRKRGLITSSLNIVNLNNQRIDEEFKPSRDVYEILIDYQNDTKGGNGWYKIFKFYPNLGEIHMDVLRVGGENVRFAKTDDYPGDPQLHNYTVKYSKSKVFFAREASRNVPRSFE